MGGEEEEGDKKGAGSEGSKFEGLEKVASRKVGGLRKLRGLLFGRERGGEGDSKAPKCCDAV